MKMAKKPAEKEMVGSLGNFFREIITKKAVNYLLILRFLRIVAGCGTGVYLFYLQHVSGEDRDGVGRYGIIVPISGMFIQILSAVFWGMLVS